MTTKTLGGFLTTVERKRKRQDKLTPLSARANVYDAMGRYVATAGNHPIGESTHHHSAILGSLIHALAVDARINLTPEKYRYLSEYPLTEDIPRQVPTQERLDEALRNTWGADDRFIGHLSGGLFGSYMKALTTLKPHARALGRDLSEAAGDYLKGL